MSNIGPTCDRVWPALAFQGGSWLNQERNWRNDECAHRKNWGGLGRLTPRDQERLQIAQVGHQSAKGWKWSTLQKFKNYRLVDGLVKG